jgi:acyl-coenzyme A synthetase/AMP-(fatty) acid ligase
MQRDNPTSLHFSILAARSLSAQIDMGSAASGSWGELAGGAAFAARSARLRGRSVLVETAGQLAAAEAMIQLDGVVRRMVLYPPDMSREHLAFVSDAAETDELITEDPDLKCRFEHLLSKRRPPINPRIHSKAAIETEWILLTSGTTGTPKLVKHTLATLTGAIKPRDPSAEPIVWSTFYDIRRYGGLQIFLRAALTGTPLVLSSPQEPLADFLTRAGKRGITHISGTPSQWRRVLMSPAARAIAPSYIRLSGEIADQAILNQLQSRYPNAKIAHAFASTEAGVVLQVNDVVMGISADAIGPNADVETKVEEGTLRVRSNRTAFEYLGKNIQPLKDAHGFVDTSDVLELREGRYYFSGRRDGIINVGGLKVHPEEVEAVLNRHPDVGMSLVRTRKSSITGGLVVADVVLRKSEHPEDDAKALQRDILSFCREQLALYKVPVGINFVSTLAVAETGKLIRRDA